MTMPDFYLGSTDSPSVLLNFDGRVRECSIIDRPEFRASDGHLVRSWYVEVVPPLPVMRGWPVEEPIGTISKVVLLVTDGQNLDALERDAANVTVQSFKTPRRPEQQAVLSFGELVDEWSFAEVTRDRSYLERYGKPFVTGHALMAAHEFATYLRGLNPEMVRAAEAKDGPLEQLGNLELSVLFWKIEDKRQEALGLPPS